MAYELTEHDAITRDGRKAEFVSYSDSAWPAPWTFRVAGRDYCYSVGGFVGNHQEPEHPLDLVGAYNPIIAGKTLGEWREFARRDDCLDRMVPSDLRQLIGAIN